MRFHCLNIPLFLNTEPHSLPSQDAQNIHIVTRRKTCSTDDIANNEMVYFPHFLRLQRGFTLAFLTYKTDTTLQIQRISVDARQINCNMIGKYLFCGGVHYVWVKVTLRRCLQFTKKKKKHGRGGGGGGGGLSCKSDKDM